jgi:hypothetical protein
VSNTFHFVFCFPEGHTHHISEHGDQTKNTAVRLRRVLPVTAEEAHAMVSSLLLPVSLLSLGCTSTALHCPYHLAPHLLTPSRFCLYVGSGGSSVANGLYCFVRTQVVGRRATESSRIVEP